MNHCRDLLPTIMGGVLVAVAVLSAGCTHDLDSVVLPCSDEEACAKGSVCVKGRCVSGSADAGKDIAGKEAGKPEAGVDAAVKDQEVADRKVATDKALTDKAKPADQTPDKAKPVPDKALPDKMIPDKTLAPDIGTCGNKKLDPSEPCDDTQFQTGPLCIKHLDTGIVYTGGNLKCFSCKIDTSGCTWAIQGGSTGDDKAQGLAVTSKGKIVFVGQVAGSGSISGTPYSVTNKGNHLLLGRITDKGAYDKHLAVWAGGGSVNPGGMDVDKGHAYITGTFDNQLTFSTALSGTPHTIFAAMADLTLWKWDWWVKGPSHANNTAHDVLMGPNTAYITGTVAGPVQLGTQYISSARSRICYSAVVTPGGKLGAPIYGTGAADCRSYSSMVASTTHIFMGGNGQGNISYHGKNLHGANNGHVVRIKFSGSVYAAKNVISPGQVRALTTDGTDVYVGGNFSSNASTPQGGINLLKAPKDGKNDAFVIKLSSALKYQWSARSTGLSNEYVRDLAYHNNGIYVLGDFQGTSITLGSHVGYRTGTNDVFVAKLNSVGVWQWLMVTSGVGTGARHAGRIAVDGKGHVYVSGWFTGKAKFGKSTTLQSGGKDLFIWKIKDPQAP